VSARLIPSFRRLITAALLAAALAGPLAACGKKGAPMAPKDEPNVYPRAYPSDKPAPTDTKAEPTRSGSTD
jgi:hypothetical protein